MARVLVCDRTSEDALAKISNAGHQVVKKYGMTPEELISTVPDFDCMVVRSATKVRVPVIDAAKKLKLIVRGGVGIDNIDVEYARSKGIEVRNTPSASSASVAELAIAHMFSLYRFVGASNVTMRKGEWNKKQYRGKELDGKILGIIGLGRIGRHLARRAKGLFMHPIAYDPFIKEKEIEGVPLVSLDELLAKSDIVSLHIPKQEKPILGREEIAKMKDGAVLINTARGGLVDEVAVKEALDSGKLWGYGVDVYPKEPPEEFSFYDHPRISCTPHLGATTEEGQARVGEEVAKIIIDFFK
ncbi:D-2-hydroxyacid dehydrogenase [bacterium]|nr:D-2-hydroxyacid dehydrogenase [bacterium]